MKSFPCPNCKGKIGYEPQDAGQVGTCPHCGITAKVPESKRKVIFILVAAFVCLWLLIWFIFQPKAVRVQPQPVLSHNIASNQPSKTESMPITNRPIVDSAQNPPILPQVSRSLTDQTNQEASEEWKATIRAKYELGRDYERSVLIAQDYGVSPTAKLIRQFDTAMADCLSLSNQIAQLETSNLDAKTKELTKAGLQGRMVYAEEARIGLLLAIRRDRAEVERDINQLQIDQQRQFFFGR